MDSRYSRGTTAWVDHPVEGRVQVVHLAPLRFTNYPYTKVLTSLSDSMTSLAHHAYGDATKYWFIAQMNPGVVSPDDLVAGTTLFVPTGFSW